MNLYLLDHNYSKYGIKKTRVRRKLKLSINQRKKQKQFIHSRNDFMKKSVKRKSDDIVPCELSEKTQILDFEGMKQKELDEILKCEQMELNEEDGEGISTNSFNFVVHEKKSSKCLSRDESESKCTSSDESDRSAEENTRENLPDQVNKSYDEFHKDSLLCPLLMKLHEVDLLKDFMLMIQSLSDRIIPCENLPLIFAMELAKFHNCSTTTLMRFHPKSKAFWHVGYHTWHGKGVLLLSGSKNRGEVRNKLTKRGYYNPNTSSVNLVVPDVKTLFNTNDTFPKNIDPTSCIKESFELLDKRKEHVLMYDLKKVVHGFKGKQYGDEDLWSFEGPPSLKESRCRIEHEHKNNTRHKELLQRGKHGIGIV